MSEDPHPPSDRGAATPQRLGNHVGLIVLGAAFAFLIGAVIFALVDEGERKADPANIKQVTLGKSVYFRHCAACHGAALEGQPNWQARLPSGRMPAPPHDASGHTWHHPDAILFGITKHGLIPGKYAPPSHESDMPAFGNQLSDDEIWAVLAYIKSRWPEQIRAAQREITRNAARH